MGRQAAVLREQVQQLAAHLLRTALLHMLPVVCTKPPAASAATPAAPNPRLVEHLHSSVRALLSEPTVVAALEATKPAGDPAGRLSTEGAAASAAGHAGVVAVTERVLSSCHLLLDAMRGLSRMVGSSVAAAGQDVCLAPGVVDKLQRLKRKADSYNAMMMELRGMERDIQV